MENETNWKKRILSYLPDRIADAVRLLPDGMPVEEIRIRAGRPMQVCFAGFERLIYAPGGRPMADAADCAEILSRLCGHSVYAFEAELSGGYIPLPGGCRVGITGRCVERENGKRHIEDVASINFRIARAGRGAANKLIGRISDGFGSVLASMLISAPGCGKTTMLRDLARICSDGQAGLRPHRVAIVDTRCEIAGCVQGIPQFEIGARTDVRSGGGRAEGIRQMILTMSPEILITDELSSTEDAYAVLDAVGAGVTVIASAHAGTMDLLTRRPPLLALIAERVFCRYVLLDRSSGVGTVRAVFDAEGRETKEAERIWQKQLQC